MPAWRGYRASIRQWRARVGLLRKLELQAGGASEWSDVGAAGEPPGGLAGAVPARSPGSAISSRGLGRNTPGPAVLAAAGTESAGGASGSCIRLDWAEFPAGAGGASAGAVRPGRHAAHRRGRLAVKCTCCRPRRPGAAHAGRGGQHVSGCEEGPLKGRYPKLLRNSTLTPASGNSGSFTHARQFETCNLRALTRVLSALLVQRRYRSQRVLVYWLAPNATCQLQ